MGHCRECGTELTEKWLEVDSMSLDGVSADEVDLATWFTLEEAADRLRQGTRRYAKRQLTWFRREEAIHWIERDRVSDDRLLQEVSSIVAKELSIRYNEEEPDSGVPKKNSENQAAEGEREV